MRPLDQRDANNLYIIFLKFVSGHTQVELKKVGYHIEFDLFGPSPDKETGNTYLLILICHLTDVAKKKDIAENNIKRLGG